MLDPIGVRQIKAACFRAHLASQSNQCLQWSLDPIPTPTVAGAALASSATEVRRYAAEDTRPLAGKAGAICRRRDSARSVRYCPKVDLSATGFAGYLRTRYAPTFSHIR